LSDEELGRELAEARQQIASLQRELAETNSGTVALTVELEDSREAIAKQAEALRRANKDLEALNAELGAFGYSVSHDLRAPLRSIIGFSQVIVEDHGHVLGDDGLAALARVQGAARRMDNLVTDLLQLSRAGRADLICDELDLSAIAGQVAAGLREADKEREVQVEIAAGMKCTGDVRLMAVVLENLIGNAWKFTSQTPQPRIEIGVTVKDGEQAFFVRDNGAGFDMRYADRLFAPFERLHAMEEFPGTGVGLATVRRIVRRHGGRIWAEAVVGKGACFSVTLGCEVSEPVKVERS
jgi:light-regulated signal transduction histidine kinase (bacteriophytochrome)